MICKANQLIGFYMKRVCTETYFQTDYNHSRIMLTLSLGTVQRKLYLRYRNIENMTQFICLKLYRLRLFIQVNVLLFSLFLNVLPDCTRRI